MTVDQANLLLIPIEIARIISILIHGSDHREHKQGALKQVGCYVDKFSQDLMSSIQIEYLDESYEDEEEEKKNDKKMMSLQRKAFIDDELYANKTFSKKVRLAFFSNQ